MEGPHYSLDWRAGWNDVAHTATEQARQKGCFRVRLPGVVAAKSLQRPAGHGRLRRSTSQLGQAFISQLLVLSHPAGPAFFMLP
jgi:hypothetical protein